MKNKNGLIMVYTGNGKGKTTAALGLAFRAAGHGEKVLIINFMKGWKYGEAKAAAFLPGFEVIKAGREKFVDKDNPDKEDIELARKGFRKAKEALTSGTYDLVVLDEMNNVVDFNLVPLKDVLDLLENKHSEVNVVLTGRNAPLEIIELADMVSEVKDIKHHFDKGIPARKGIEF